MSPPESLMTVKVGFSRPLGSDTTASPDMNDFSNRELVSSPRSIIPANSMGQMLPENGAACENGQNGRKEFERTVVQVCLQQVDQLGPECFPLYVAIPALWWRQWKLWSSADDSELPRPKQIELCFAKVDGLVRGVDYEWIPEEVWNAVSTWYGYDGKEPIYRAADRSVRDKVKNKKRGTSIYEDYNLPPIPGHWDTSWTDLSACNTLVDGDRCETCLRVGAKKICSRCKRARYCDHDCQASVWKFHKVVCHPKELGNHDDNDDGDEEDEDDEGATGSPPGRRGLVGLSNLGNTCYLNSTIQCISHVWPLTRYFLCGKYKADRNLESKLGTGGRFAAAWDALLKQLWFGETTSIAPVNLKRSVATLPGSGNQFAGFGQHDAQELLVFLLDTLHEDLNLVKRKPYIPDDDYNINKPTRSIADLAAESWSRHLQREHSMVNHLFQGQLHNTVVCPRCKYRSNTFSPFMFLPLALPVNIDRVLFVTVVRQMRDENDRLSVSQVRYAVSVSPTARCAALKLKLGDLCGVQVQDQWLVEICNHQIRAEYLDGDPINKISTNADIYVYELTSPSTVFGDEELVEKSEDGGDQTQDQNIREAVILHRNRENELIGTPLILRFHASISCVELRRGIAHLLEAALSSRKQAFDGKSLPLSCVDYEGNETPEASEFPNDDEGKSIEKDAPAHISAQNTIFLAMNWDRDASEGGPREEKSIDGDLFVYQLGKAFQVHDHESAIKQLEKIRKRLLLEQKYRGESYTLHECLNYFSNVERLGSGNSWTCPKCKSAQQAYKMMNIIRLPEVLILSLKRFSGHRGGKIGAFVDFPFEGLDMAPYLAEFGGEMEKQDTTFDLFAVTNHFGTAGYGHYTAFVARQASPDSPVAWFEYDDSRVTQVSKESVLSSAAYVLYYKRRRTWQDHIAARHKTM